MIIVHMCFACWIQANTQNMLCYVVLPVATVVTQMHVNVTL